MKKSSIDGVARLSGGSIGKAVQLITGNGYDLYKAFYRVVSSLPKLDIQSIHDLSDLASRKKDSGIETFPMLVNLIPDWIGSLILISAGGESKNMINACKYALKKNYFPIVTLTGFKKGNSLSKIGHVNFWVKSSLYNHIENTHQFLLLSLVDALKKNG